MGKSKASAPRPTDDPATPHFDARDEDGKFTAEIEQEGLARGGELDSTGYLTETEDVPELSREDQQAAIASSMGGGDQYPYVDRTQIPVHERNTSAMNNPLTEASQAELNPAFTAKAEDGGPVNAEGEGIGSEPNAVDQQLAAVENAGGDVEAAREQLDGTDQQMDVDAVNAQAEVRAPEGVDALTGQKDA